MLQESHEPNPNPQFIYEIDFFEKHLNKFRIIVLMILVKPEIIQNYGERQEQIGQSTNRSKGHPTSHLFANILKNLFIYFRSPFLYIVCRLNWGLYAVLLLIFNYFFGWNILDVSFYALLFWRIVSVCFETAVFTIDASIRWL